MIRNASAAAAAALSLAAAALGQHAEDIGLVVKAGSIHTVAVNEFGLGSRQRAFQGEFGAEGVPWVCGSPGYFAEAGTFPADASIGLRFAAPLMVWDGTAFVATSRSGPLPNERVRLSHLTLAAESGDGPAPGFDLAVPADGGLDLHPTMELLAAPGAPEPRAGVYLLQLEVYSGDPAIGSCEPVWIVLNAGADTAEHEAAYKFARDVVDPSDCAADLNGDRAVDGTDLGMLLSGWDGVGAADLDADGIVSGNDLGLLLGSWGTCP